MVISTFKSASINLPLFASAVTSLYSPLSSCRLVVYTFCLFYVKQPSERRKNLLKTVAKSSKQRYVPIVRQSLPLQATDRFSAQRSVAIKQGRIKRKPTEKRKKAITIIVSVYVLCVAVPTGLHTVSRNSAPRNVKR